jgi:hypothetical protein
VFDKTPANADTEKTVIAEENEKKSADLSIETKEKI